ncbi:MULTISPECIES: hypothetical protein [Bradyrhizobium]|uniref:hypothetical protein n=1 Tax=Bradyrhizobium TaxID=374 RepID=UPI0012AB8EAF|nr:MULTISPECIES: hypothetical protein [Bradyrhizobium]
MTANGAAVRAARTDVCPGLARWITVTYFIALAIVVTALLLVRRSLKWRYPI